ncbi:MAG: hypothetical protein RLZZ58_1801 [Pseudomonadota bacterium]
MMRRQVHGMNLRTLMIMAAALSLSPIGTAVADDDDPAAAPAPGWRTVATQQDRARIRGWWATWENAIAAARASGHGGEIEADAALFAPGGALPNPHLPPGAYRCRTVKLGMRGGTDAGTAAVGGYIAYPWFACRVTAEQGLFSFAKLDGSQRPMGLIFQDNARRQIFLGTLMLGEERTPLNYGDDPHRDMAGLVERIGATRWRIVLPQPAFESLLDVIELVPAG